MSFEDRIHRCLSAYIASPQWFKSSARRVYSWLPVRLRRGARYGEFCRLLAVRDSGGLAMVCRNKLSETLTWAIETVPAYRGYRRLFDALDTPAEALRQLPTVSKMQIKNDLERYLSTRMPHRMRLPALTGGSTANPMLFYLEKGVSRAREYAFMDNFHARSGFEADELVLSLRGQTVPTAKAEGGCLWMHEPIKRQLILSSDHLERRYMSEYMAAMRQWKPRYVEAFPSGVYALARWLADRPEPEITERIRGVMMYSENVYDFPMRLFRQVFGCPVLKHYGHSERVLMAATMPDDERYFFWPQ